jgi:toxin ParE1/3/4
MNIKWSRFAKKDLEQLRQYIAESNPTAENQIAKKILESITLLTQHPALGKKGRLVDTRELIVSGTPYIIPYTIKNNTIEILRVYHSSRKSPEEI